MNQIALVVTPEQLDFISRRMTAGKMMFQEAKLTDELLQILVGQANNKELQAKLLTPAPAPATPSEQLAEQESKNG